MAFEVVAAICTAVALALAAPTATRLLGGALGPQATVSALLLSGLALAVAISSFAATGSLLRDRNHAEATAAGIQSTLLAGAAVAMLGTGIVPELALVAGLGLVGLLLVLLSFGSARR